MSAIDTAISTVIAQRVRKMQHAISDVSKQSDQFVNLPWAAFIQIIAGAVDSGVERSRRVAFVGESLIYRGEATPGADENAAVWRIKRIEFAVDGDVSEKWAGGNAEFNKAWNDRAALEYV